MITKRGQAAGAAVLLAIIVGLLLMFIILIPPQERVKLLEDAGAGTTAGRGIAQRSLLVVNPGRIDFLAQKEVEHPLPAINIFTTTESRILAQRNVAMAKKGVFSEETTDFSFTVPDVQNTRNALLTFKVIEAVGRIVIALNGEKVFDAEAASGAVKPISLPINSLHPENKLVFAVSSPGIAFWQTNEISLEDIKVVADVTSLEAQSSRNIFLVSETEKKNLERATLRFQPECDPLDVGRLVISINENEVYNAIPDCDIAMIPIEFDPALLNQGENEIVISAIKGTYQLSHVSVLSKLREIDFPTYYFELSREEYQEILQGRLKAKLRIDFVDVVAVKQGDLTFNGHLIHIDTRDVSYTLDLSDDVVQGSNVIKIRPRKTLEIRELRVDLLR